MQQLRSVLGATARRAMAEGRRNPATADGDGDAMHLLIKGQGVKGSRTRTSASYPVWLENYNGNCLWVRRQRDACAAPPPKSPRSRSCQRLAAHGRLPLYLSSIATQAASLTHLSVQALWACLDRTLDVLPGLLSCL